MEPGGRPPPVSAGSGAGWVLVCDDTESIRLLICINLELAGFEVLEADDGAAALQILDRLRDNLPAAVVLDAQMEPVDGWAVIASVRGDPDLRHLPVVMVTASLQQRERERAAEAGIDAFVAKPFVPDDLVHCVCELATRGRPRAQS